MSDQSAAGQSKQDFCADRKINPATFYYWQKRLRELENPTAGGQFWNAVGGQFWSAENNEQRKAYRLIHTAPLYQKLKDWADEQASVVTPKSPGC